jgi:hypothetical protein
LVKSNLDFMRKYEKKKIQKQLKRQIVQIKENKNTFKLGYNDFVYNVIKVFNELNYLW